jgi:hypothetical protein
MAQVYQFVDDNGVTRLFAEIVPDPAGTPFNGGTITSELIVDTAATTGQALELTGTRTTQQPVFKIDYPHQTVSIDSDGVVAIGSDDTLDVTLQGTSSPARLHVASDQTNRCDTDLRTDAGVRTTAVGSGLALMEVVNANGDNVFRAITFAGSAEDALVFKINAAPADGELAAGECALWFDQTDGAGKLMVKAKTANGTVVTAAIALA